MMSRGKSVVCLMLTGLLCLFAACGFAATLTLPAGLKVIEEEAFLGNTSLDEVVLPEGLERIESRAFADSSVSLVHLSSQISFIDEDAFEGCEDIQATAPRGTYAYEWAKNKQMLYFESTSVKSFEYSIDSGKVTITRFVGDETEVVIPSSIAGYSVDRIGESAFENCTCLESIIIPNSVTSIGKRAFWYCSQLKDVVIPDSVTVIDDFSFRSCGIKSITIPNSVISIGAEVFDDCRELISITLSESLESIGDRAFARCESLKSITIPNSVISIGAEVFESCSSLSNVKLSDSLKNIGEQAFIWCESLTNITIPGSVTNIGEQAFYDCSNLKSIILLDSIKCISDYAFERCIGLTSIVIPNSVTSIGEGTFRYCINLENITMSDSLESIGWWAFEGCRKLTNIKLPDSVTSIGSSVFEDCINLTSVELPNSLTEIPYGTFDKCSSLINIEIPDSVTSIGSQAFNACSSLISVTIPDSVTTIIGSAFMNCANLTSVMIPESVKDFGATRNFFDNCPNLTIYGIVGSRAEDFAYIYGIPFSTNKMPNAFATLSGFTLNSAPVEITVPVGTSLAFSGTVTAAENTNLVAVQASIFDASDLSKGVVFDSEENISADTFDLSEFDNIVVGQPYSDDKQTLTMEAGKSYDVMLYATNTNGCGFASIPTIRVNVVEEEEEEPTDWYATVTDAAGNNLTQTGIQIDYAGVQGKTIYVRTNNGDMTAWCDVDFPFTLTAPTVELQADGTYLFTYQLSAQEDTSGMAKEGVLYFCLRDENGNAMTDSPLAQVRIEQGANHTLPVVFSVVDSAGNDLTKTPLTIDYTGACVTSVIVHANRESITAWFNSSNAINFGAPVTTMQEDGTYLLTYNNITATENATANEIVSTCVFYAYETDAAQPDKSRALAEVQVVRGANPHVPTLINLTRTFEAGHKETYDKNNPFLIFIDAVASCDLNVSVPNGKNATYRLYCDNPNIATVEHNLETGEINVQALEVGTANLYISHITDMDTLNKIPTAYRYYVCSIDVGPKIRGGTLIKDKEQYNADSPMTLYVGEDYEDYAFEIDLESRWTEPEYTFYSDNPDSVQVTFSQDTGTISISASDEGVATIYISHKFEDNTDEIPEKWLRKVCDVYVRNKTIVRGLTVGATGYKGLVYRDSKGNLSLRYPEDWIQPQNSIAETMGNFFKDNSYVDGMMIVTYCTKNALKREIINMFENATEDDVSMIYINAHGGYLDVDKDGKDESCMTFQTKDTITQEEVLDNYLMDKELLEWIDDYSKGKVVVFIDSCHSGNFVNVFGASKKAEKYTVIAACEVDEEVPLILGTFSSAIQKAFDTCEEKTVRNIAERAREHESFWSTVGSHIVWGSFSKDDYIFAPLSPEVAYPKN